jgi:hypothetical protein
MMAVQEFAEKEIMSMPSCWQNDVVTSFLRVSRAHFGLDQRSAGGRARVLRLPRSILQSLLIAGGLSGSLGGVAHAVVSGTPSSETGAELASPECAQSVSQAGHRLLVERMP